MSECDGEPRLVKTVIRKIEIYKCPKCEAVKESIEWEEEVRQ